MTPTLFHVPKTISSPIYQALLELGVSNEVVRVQTLSFSDLKTPEHLARNPMGTSPTYTDADKGIAIWESGAVISLLLNVHDKEYRLHPNPAKVSEANLAKFLHLQQYILATVYPYVASLFIHTLQPDDKQDKTYVATAKDKWNSLLAPTLMSFLGDSKFFIGESISAIDLLVAKPLNNADALGLLEAFPSLLALLREVQSLPSFAVAYNNPQSHSCPECRSLVLVPGDKD